MIGPRACRSPRQKPPLAGEDKLAGAAPGAARTDNSGNPLHIHAMSRPPTPVAAPLLSTAPAPIGPGGKYTDKNLQRTA